MAFKTQSMKIPVITLWQPWAQFIAEGWKTIETRTHNRFNCLAGFDILIHAGAKWDTLGFQSADPYIEDELTEQFYSIGKIEPQILCMVHVDFTRILNVHDSFCSLIDCGKTIRHGLFLSNVRKNEPIYMKGHQGIWYVDESILQ